MFDITILVKIFFFGFLLNVVWELAHSVLYATCLKNSHRENVFLLLKMSGKDAGIILLFYLASRFIFGVINLFTHPPALIFFVGMALLFAFVDERISVRRKRWAYAPAMPVLFGVGATPLLELAITGVGAIGLTFLL